MQVRADRAGDWAGDWTLVITCATGTACIVAMGENRDSVTPDNPA